MRSTRLIPIAVLGFAAACSDTATSPTSLTSADGPLAFQVSPGTTVGTLNEANTPGGGHLQSGAISCTVNADLSISCSSYELAGVGNTDAFLSLVANYTATIDCNNPGNNRNNPIESHEGSFSDSDTETLSSGKNGRLRVPTASVSTAAAAIGCPNPNWQPEIREGSLQLVSYTYTLSFPGEAGAAVLIQEP